MPTPTIMRSLNLLSWLIIYVAIVTLLWHQQKFVVKINSSQFTFDGGLVYAGWNGTGMVSDAGTAAVSAGSEPEPGSKAVSGSNSASGSGGGSGSGSGTSGWFSGEVKSSKENGQTATPPIEPTPPLKLVNSKELLAFDPHWDPLDCSSEYTGSVHRVRPDDYEPAVQIQLHVIAWQRPEPLQSLLNQLSSAHYSTTTTTPRQTSSSNKNYVQQKIPLYIHIDSGYSPNVAKIAQSFQWDHGPKIVQIQQVNLGLRNMWFAALGIGANAAAFKTNTLMVCLEDDMHVSSYYFQWLVEMIHMYARNPHCRDSKLMGFSLSPIKMEELRKPFTRWNARKELRSDKHGEDDSAAYLSVVPSSWGAAYWADQWIEFDAFRQVRATTAYYDFGKEARLTQPIDYENLQLTSSALELEDSRSNKWNKSWKRFLVDFMYARGLVILYPSLKNERGLATTMALTGEHIPGTVNSTWKNPRVAELVIEEDDTGWDILSEGVFPKYNDLPVLDLHLNPKKHREDLNREGVRFLLKMYSKCLSAKLDNCDGLMKAWKSPGTWFSRDITTASKQSLLLCAPDHYMPSSELSHRQMETGPDFIEDRYLLYEPQYGGNNQLFGVVEAFFWARILGRRLVLPPLMLPRTSAYMESGDIADILRFPMIDDLIRVGETYHDDSRLNYRNSLSMPKLVPISLAEFLQKNVTPTRFLQVGRIPLLDKQSYHVISAVASQKGGSRIVPVPARHMVDVRKVSLDESWIQQQFGGCNDKVLAFDDMFLVNLRATTFRNDKFEAMPEVLKLAPKAKKIAATVRQRMILEKLATINGDKAYVCMHLRLGDMRDLCQTKSFQNIPYFMELLKEGFSCAVNAQDMLMLLRQVDKPVLLMSDNPEEVKQILYNSTVSAPYVTSDWIETAVQTELAKNSLNVETAQYVTSLSMLIEQDICSTAASAYLSKFSTVSRRIELLRNFKNVLHWGNGAVIPGKKLNK